MLVVPATRAMKFVSACNRTAKEPSGLPQGIESAVRAMLSLGEAQQRDAAIGVLRARSVRRAAPALSVRPTGSQGAVLALSRESTRLGPALSSASGRTHGTSATRPSSLPATPRRDRDKSGPPLKLIGLRSPPPRWRDGPRGVLLLGDLDDALHAETRVVDAILGFHEAGLHIPARLGGDRLLLEAFV
jgi:hypothetical protein